LQSPQAYEAIILGAGPAGTAAAGRLAQAGRKVLVFERERFPRFHIGESLLPESNHVFSQLGLQRRLDERGYVSKRGASIISECESKSVRIAFEGAPGIEQPFTYHVLRADFDQLLMDRARELGAVIRSGCEVLDVDLLGEYVRVRTTEGEFEGRFVLDATGRRGLIANRLRLRKAEPKLRKTALYAHFRGIPRPEGAFGGDIRIIVRDDGGWIWLIPLPDELMSVGFVFDNAEDLRHQDESPEECLERWMAEVPLLHHAADSIERVGAARWEGHFSYCAQSYSGSNWLLLGDAGFFLDPVFSWGVHLALRTGLEAANVVDRSLVEGPRKAVSLLKDYNRSQKRRHKFLRRLAIGFYRPAFRDLLFQPEAWPAGARALASVLSGNDNPDLRTRIRLGLLFMIVAFQERFQSTYD